MRNYRYELAKQRKKEIETHRFFLLFREFLDLLEVEAEDTDIDKEISDIETLEYDAFDPTQ